MLERLRSWARRIKRDSVMLWSAGRDARTPLLAKALSVAIVAYVLSPIDLIPDFIPILGYLDEVILLPLLIALVVRLLPDDVVTTCRARAEVWLAGKHAKPVSYAGAAFIVLLWCLAAWLVWRAVMD